MSDEARFKYPKTFHLPWSPGITDQDRVLKSVDQFVGRKVVVTEKIDGECTTLYPDYLHARSIDSKFHPSRSWIRSLHGQVRGDIPQGWRVCGENVFAKHSIYYDRLPTYFLVFSIWNEDNYCLDWGSTKEFAGLLDLQMVPELYVGLWNEAVIKKLFTGKSAYGPEQEGYVVRSWDGFHFSEFQHNVAKYVRAGHVQTDQNWLSKPVEPNKTL